MIRFITWQSVFLGRCAFRSSGVVPNRAEADRATARELAAAGYHALKRGDYAVAADHFERADALVHAPTLVVDWARALTGLGLLVEAGEKYELVIREGVEPDGAELLAPRARRRSRRARSAAAETGLVDSHRQRTRQTRHHGRPDPFARCGPGRPARGKSRNPRDPGPSSGLRPGGSFGHARRRSQGALEIALLAPAARVLPRREARSDRRSSLPRHRRSPATRERGAGSLTPPSPPAEPDSSSVG